MAATALAVLISTALLSVGILVLVNASLANDQQRAVRERADSAMSTLTYEHGVVEVDQQPESSALDRNVWLFAADGRVIERGNGGTDIQAAADSLSRVVAITQHEADDGDVLMLGEPVINEGQVVGTLVSAISTEPYERTLKLAAVMLAGFSGLAVLGCSALAAILVTVALRPVARMTAQAAEWSETAADQRFAMGPGGDEISALAHTLDGLLDRLSASLRYEQRFSAELAHELRTPLTSLMAETEIGLRHAGSLAQAREALDLIHKQAQRMARIIDVLMTAAEQDADPSRSACDLGEAVNATIIHWRDRALDSGVDFSVAVPARPITAGCDPALIASILDPLLDNALRFAAARIVVTMRSDGHFATVAIADDGPGIPAEAAGVIFEPGYRGPHERDSPGGGLGLSLARRLARSAGGDIVIGSSETAGAAFEIRLPSA